MAAKTKKDSPQRRDNRVVRVEEVMEICDISKGKAYEIIRQLNKELQSQGYITVAGRVPRKYFEERTYVKEKIV